MPNINEKLFRGEMSDVVRALENMVNHAITDTLADSNTNITSPLFVTVQSKGKHNAYGWMSAEKKWHISKNGEDMELAFEMNIASETLNRPLEETFITVLHELAHLYNTENGISDTTGGQVHTKKFREACDRILLKWQEDKKYGCNTHIPMAEQNPEIQQSFARYKEQYSADAELLCIHSAEEVKIAKPKKKSNAIKLVCPNCNNSVRSTKKLALICGDCYKSTKQLFEMVSESKDEESVVIPAEEIPAESVPAKTEEELRAESLAKVKAENKAKVESFMKAQAKAKAKAKTESKELANAADVVADTKAESNDDFAKQYAEQKARMRRIKANADAEAESDDNALC